jgi:signal transduction histidine kinase
MGGAQGQAGRARGVQVVVLNAGLWLTVVGAGAYALLDPSEGQGEVYPLWSAVLLATFGLWLRQLGHYRIPALVLVSAVFGLATWGVWTGGGLQSPAVPTLMLVVIVTSLLFGWRSTVGVGAAVFAQAVIVDVAASEGWIAAPRHALGDTWRVAGYLHLTSLTVLASVTAHRLGQAFLMQQRQEAQSEAMAKAYELASLGRITAGVAHEVSNPTATILLNARAWRRGLDELWPAVEAYAREHGEFLVAGAPATQARQRLGTSAEDIARAAERIKVVIDGLRKLAHEDEPGPARPVQLHEVVTGAVAVSRHSLERAGVRIQMADVAVQPPVLANAAQLELALITLLTRLCAAPAGATTVRIATALDPEHGAVVCDVADDGTPLAEAGRLALTEPFTGALGNDQLDLQYVGRVVRRHGGAVTFPTQESGTLVRIRLPLAASVARGVMPA